MAKILFIDDDTNTLELMEKITQILGHEAVICPQANQAVHHAVQDKPDMIMVDVNMQEFNGFDVVRQIRQTIPNTNIPILILSASDPDLETNQAIAAGASGYLPKPLTILGLTQVLEKYNTNHHP